MIKVLQQPIKKNNITLSDLNDGDIFLILDTNHNIINESPLYMRIKQEQNTSYLCWNFVDNYYQNISPPQIIHKCAIATLRYTI